MNQNILFITLVCLVVVGIYIIMVRNSSKDSFEETPVENAEQYQGDTLVYETKEHVCDCSDPSRIRGNGLIMSYPGMDIETFIQKTGTKTPLNQVPNLYCATMYENCNQYFTERWESLGICEQENTEKIDPQNIKTLN
jgi:hypothetical protein